MIILFPAYNFVGGAAAVAESVNALAHKTCRFGDVEINSLFSDQQVFREISRAAPSPPMTSPLHCYTATGRKHAQDEDQKRAMASTSVQQEARL